MAKTIIKNHSKGISHYRFPNWFYRIRKTSIWKRFEPINNLYNHHNIKLEIEDQSWGSIPITIKGFIIVTEDIILLTI